MFHYLLFFSTGKEDHAISYFTLFFSTGKEDQLLLCYIMNTLLSRETVLPVEFATGADNEDLFPPFKKLAALLLRIHHCIN